MKAVALALHPCLKAICVIRWPDFKKFVPPPFIPAADDTIVADEWDKYLAIPIARERAPDFNDFKLHAEWCLDWWDTHQSVLPIVSLLARRMYSLPISSANCERVFARIAEHNPSNFEEDNFERFVQRCWNTTQFQRLNSPDIDELLHH